ncbi:hypothetical protein [Moraxella caviae]|uniref:hypothetical protein n=1 Tax=Moraxella caviae TaxID=34060 RepID=UPI00117F0CD9|nr:hypothetical protein [Moraxella caviae]
MSLGIFKAAVIQICDGRDVSQANFKPAFIEQASHTLTFLMRFGASFGVSKTAKHKSVAQL